MSKSKRNKDKKKEENTLKTKYKVKGRKKSLKNLEDIEGEEEYKTYDDELEDYINSLPIYYESSDEDNDD